MRKSSWLLFGTIVFASSVSFAQELALPESGFVSGRPATEADVKDGNAAFFLKSGEAYVGSPVPITIPQYGLYSHDGTKTPVIVIQAEEVNGTNIVGVRDKAGAMFVAAGRDVELFGTTPPPAAELP